MSSPPTRRTCRWLKRCLLILLAAVALWLVASYAVAYKLTRRPHAQAAEPIPSITWATIHPHRIATDDGIELGAWFIAGAEKRPTVILLHGLGLSRSACLGEAEMLTREGCSVLLLSLRAHGDSTGEVNDFGYSARRDVLAAVAWLELKKTSGPIIVWGNSLGAAAALFAAGDLGQRTHGYILQCPYRDLPTAIQNRTRIALPPVLDWLACAGLRLMGPLVLDDSEHISPLDASARMPREMPVLILAGSADNRALPEEAEAIREQIGGSAKLVIIEGAGHSDLIMVGRERVRSEIRDLFQRCERQHPRSCR